MDNVFLLSGVLIMEDKMQWWYEKKIEELEKRIQNQDETIEAIKEGVRAIRKDFNNHVIPRYDRCPHTEI